MCWVMVAGKQVMAIYQSGGEFKTDKDALLLYKGGDACSILLMLWKLATKWIMIYERFQDGGSRDV